MPSHYFSAARMSLLALCALASCSVYAADTWRAYTSENFTVYSDGSEGETKRIVESFELFRDSAMSVLGLAPQPESQRLLIVVYTNKRDYDRIAPQGSMGFYYDAIFGPRMIMFGAPRESEARSVLFHEYVHHLTRSRSSLNYPRWYTEGLATVLQTTKIGNETIEIGAAPTNYVTAIRYGMNTRIADLLAPDADTRVGNFYIGSWLLSHYLLLGNPERRVQTADYLKRYDAGEDPIAAFEASFGVSPADMGLEVLKYSSRRMIGGLAAARHERTLNISTRTLAADEALLLLADVAVERGSYDTADKFFDEANKLGDESKYRTNLMSRRAIAYIHQRKTAEADELMSRVAATENQDADILGDIAHYAYDKFVEIRTGRAQGSAEDELARAIDFGVRAVEADPANLEAHYYLGLSYEAADQLQKAVDALLAGYEINPASAWLNTDLVRVMIKGRQYEYATYLASRLYSLSHAEQWRAELGKLLDDLADNDVDYMNYAPLVPGWQRSTEQ